jgi:hypothetical protein
MYKILKNSLNNFEVILRLSDNAQIPKAEDNTDYQQFKRDIQNGVVLNDSDDNPVTGDALATFIGTLP